MELLPGVEFACEATYSLTQADVDAAEVINTASVSGVARDVESTEVRLNSANNLRTSLREWLLRIAVASIQGQRLLKIIHRAFESLFDSSWTIVVMFSSRRSRQKILGSKTFRRTSWSR